LKNVILHQVMIYETEQMSFAVLDLKIKNIIYLNITIDINIDNNIHLIQIKGEIIQLLNKN